MTDFTEETLARGTQPTERESSRRALIDRTRESWEQNATFWDERMGEGDAMQRSLVAPTVEGMLHPAPGERILDVACGNGSFARHLARDGVRVVACDFAETFIARARKRDRGIVPRIDYRMVDATNERELLELGRREFDAVVCTMALMDMADIAPLFWAIPRLLKLDGRFVFTILHPCFNHAESRFAAEEEQVDGVSRTRYSLRLGNYLDVAPSKGVVLDGQPEPTYSFHRPLSEILNAAFNAGLVMDGVAEPAFPERATPGKPFSWSNLPAVPPVFAARFRPGASLR